MDHKTILTDFVAACESDPANVDKLCSILNKIKQSPTLTQVRMNQLSCLGLPAYRILKDLTTRPFDLPGKDAAELIVKEVEKKYTIPVQVINKNGLNEVNV